MGKSTKIPSTIEVLHDEIGIPVGTVLYLSADGRNYYTSNSDEVIGDDYTLSSTEQYSVSVSTVESNPDWFNSLDPTELTSDPYTEPKYSLTITCLECGASRDIGWLYNDENGFNITITENHPMSLSCENCGVGLALEVIKN